MSKKSLSSIKIFSRIIVLCLVFSSCAKAPIDHFEILYTAGEITANGNAVKANDIINIRSLVTLQPESFCILKSGYITIFVYGGTQISFDNYNKSGLLLKLDRGICDVISTEKIPFMSLTLAFRFTGKTSFSRCIANTNYGEMWLKDGEGVIISQTGTPSTNIDENKKYMSCSDVSKLLPLSNFETDELHRVDFIVQLINHKKAEYSNNATLLYPHMQYLLTRGKINHKEIFQLRMLESERGALQKIVLKNGKIIKGYAQAKGKMMEITTPSGLTAIPQNQIKYVLHYTPMGVE